MLGFIGTETNSSIAFSGSYDPALVVLSLIAAYLGAFSGLAVVRRLQQGEACETLHRIGWLALGALILGGGVFAMHFIGMLAFKLPVAVRFDLRLTLYSAVPAIVSAAWMLQMASRREATPSRLWVGGMIGGMGIGAMHYSGMMAMRLDAQMLFEPVLFAVSIVVAVVLAALAIHARHLFPVFGLNPDSRIGHQIAPLIMAMAISGMHYTAMAATEFFPGVACRTQSEVIIDPVVVGVGVVIIFFLLVMSAIFIAYLGDNQGELAERVRLLRRVFQREHRLFFFKVLVIALGMVLGTAWIAIYIHGVTEQISHKLTKELALDRVAKDIVHEFETVVFDLNLLVDSGRMARFLEREGGESRERLVHLFRFIARERRVYDQIRFIDEHSQEIIRTGVDPGLQGIQSQPPHAPEGELVRRSFALSRGEFYVSRFEWRGDQGGNAGPPRPIIHFAAPVFDGADRRRGVVVLHVLGSVIFDRVRALAREPNQTLYLIDQDGHYLLSPWMEKAWEGEANRHATFARDFPKVWGYLESGGIGLISTGHAQFFFQSLTALLRDDIKSEFGRNHREWKVVLRVEPEGLSWSQLRDHPISLVIFSCFVVLSFVISWIVTLFVVVRRASEEAAAAALRELEFQ
ncbi:MAG: hypothetical protein HQL66_13605, partial [Magnetococcales bacterium]|nr:hypothetical protein [Magnetococcales bacterium]